MTVSPRADRPSLLATYAGCIVLGGVLTHLVSEFAAMGAGAETVAVSPRHLYLAAIAVIAIGFIAREILSLRAHASSGRDFKRVLELGLATLPFHGKRHFWAVSALLQVAIGALTEVGEGCPLCGHDVVGGIAGAIVGAIVLSFLARLLAARLPSIATATAQFLSPHPSSAPFARLTHVLPASAFAEFYWFARLFNRPPPAPHTINS